MAAPVPVAGNNCPEGCAVRKNNGRRVPEKLIQAEKPGLLVCPSCWRTWNESPSRPIEPKGGNGMDLDESVEEVGA